MTNPQIQKEKEVSSVISYRVGELEKKVEVLTTTIQHGQDKLEKKLTDLMLHFATVEQLSDVKVAAHEEHERIWKKINDVEKKVDTMQVGVNDIGKNNVTLSLVQKIVFGAATIALVAIATSIINKAIM